MLVRWVVVLVFCGGGGVNTFPLEGSGLRGSSRDVLTDPVYSVEFGGGSGVGALVREKREQVVGDGGVGGEKKGVWMRRRRRNGDKGGSEDSQYKSVKGLDYKHPFRRKVRPVGKFWRGFFLGGDNLGFGVFDGTGDWCL